MSLVLTFFGGKSHSVKVGMKPLLVEIPASLLIEAGSPSLSLGKS
jgi:hypothetical protein